MTSEKSEALQGTLDLWIVKALYALDLPHGLGIARRIEQMSKDLPGLNEGPLYSLLMRLPQQDRIVATWSASENKRNAMNYSTTKTGLEQLAIETENWERISGVVARALSLGVERYP